MRVKTEYKHVKYCNCGQNGHMSMSCPSKALLFGDGPYGSVTSHGTGVRKQLLIYTSCSSTIVESCFV